jgi:hypothetical protein
MYWSRPTTFVRPTYCVKSTRVGYRLTIFSLADVLRGNGRQIFNFGNIEGVAGKLQFEASKIAAAVQEDIAADLPARDGTSENLPSELKPARTRKLSEVH